MNPNFVNTASADPQRLAPRERILAVACDLFYRHGIRAVGVDAIAEAAGTNKMTLYRHFSSKDELVAECLRRVAAKADALWDRIEAAHPGDARAQLKAWVAALGEHLASVDERGCAMCNAAVELPDRTHPARGVIEAFKCAQRDRLARLCAAAGVPQPELLADELFLLAEGARVSLQSVGPEGPAARFVRMAEATIAQRVPIAG
ncbi:MAG TPA: helix-turn-helix domain-containing protein [Xanthobacteraceae bacterium]|nr:helix-turn-helix domain-containing protein [Xanthobacteraceae bacterium]